MKKQMNDLCDHHDFSLLRLAPTVLRARDFRLYTRDGRRLVDLWQNGGGAILGHTPPSLLREIKNTASRGLYAPFPHFLEGRFIKALSRIFPGRVFRIYAAPVHYLENSSHMEAQRVALWRPFVDSAVPLAVPDTHPVLIPVVPGIHGWRGGLPLGLCVLAIDPDFEGITTLPPGDFLPPVLLAAATRGLYDLIAAACHRAKPVYHRIEKALKDSPWQRRGIYLTLRDSPSQDEWAALFGQFLKAGFLLPPVSYQPVILPGILSPGEEAKLAEMVEINTCNILVSASERSS